MTVESYYRWALTKNIPMETKKHMLTVYLAGLPELLTMEAKCRLPPVAEDCGDGLTFRMTRKKNPGVVKPYPKYFADFKEKYKETGIITSFRHITTSPVMLFEGEKILGPDEDRSSFMYWYIVELNRHAEESRINVPYIKTEDGFIALFKSKRKTG